MQFKPYVGVVFITSITFLVIVFIVYISVDSNCKNFDVVPETNLFPGSKITNIHHWRSELNYNVLANLLGPTARAIRTIYYKTNASADSVIDHYRTFLLCHSTETSEQCYGRTENRGTYYVQGFSRLSPNTTTYNTEIIWDVCGT